MHFNVGNIIRIDVRVADNVIEHTGLIALVRPCNAVGMSTMVCVHPQDHTQDWIVVGLRIFQSLEYNGSDRIGAAVASSGVVESIAIACDWERQMLVSGFKSCGRYSPVVDKKCALSRPAKLSGLVRMLVPPASAVSQSPRQRYAQADWMAAKLDEHAVSTLMLGPEKPKKKLILPGTKARLPP